MNSAQDGNLNQPSAPASGSAGAGAPNEPGSGRVRRWLVIALILIVAGVAVLAVMPRRPEKTEAVASTAVPVATAPVVAADLPEVATYPGRVEAQTEVALASEGMGRIVALGAAKGEAVTAGQRLMSVDSRSQASAVRSAEANLRQATNDLRRMEELRSSGAVAASDFEAMQTRRDLAEIALEEARVALEKCDLHSPIQGLVLERRVELGEFVSPGTPAFRVVDIDHVKIVVDLPERDVFVVRAGQEVPFQIDSLGDESFTGRVAYVAAAAHPLSNTFRTEIAAENADHLLKPGVIARIRLTRRTIPMALSVPLEALVPGKGQYVAYVVENGIAIRRIVKLAAVVDSRAVVSDGLKQGEQVVVEGQRLVADGVAVTTSGR